MRKYPEKCMHQFFEVCLHNSFLSKYIDAWYILQFKPKWSQMKFVTDLYIYIGHIMLKYPENNPLQFFPVLEV